MVAVPRVRAVRGAIQVDRDDPECLLAGTRTLLVEVIRRNELCAEDIISLLFTVTPDLACDFPAGAARGLGLTDVPMLCASEIAVPGALERVIRLLAHIQTDRPRAAIEHVYLGGASALRPDLHRPSDDFAPRVTTSSGSDELHAVAQPRSRHSATELVTRSAEQSELATTLERTPTTW